MVRDERNLEGKICVFNTHGMDSEWKIHDGEKCTVKKRKSEDEYDYEDIGTMWEIKLDNGKELDAFPDELEECENNA